ncbi:helix-turn-helix domain-containing protein [Gemmobacter aquatilis]|uniref:helix-turn-helix domain-containing protein n=1 Tax=Gemmobacter aquatilis TaxID=933059 RepID=UPI00111432F9|nr:helix-turn-helix domain-containing protein [Gemmobacter aquatilis]
MLKSGQDLREMRIELGISQARLAEISGVEQHKISAYELNNISLDDRSVKSCLMLLVKLKNLRLKLNEKRDIEGTRIQVRKMTQKGRLKLQELQGI